MENVIVTTSKKKSKVKSITSEGYNAVTYAHYYKIKGTDEAILYTRVLYLSPNIHTEDLMLRKFKGLNLHERVNVIKVSTLIETLYNLEILQ